VGSVVIDDHLLRDVLAGERSADLGLAAERIATTGLWLFRLSSSYADPRVRRKLSAPVASLSPDLQAAFRARLTALPDQIEVIAMRQLAWPMAELQRRHRARGHNLSAAMVEALAAAHQLQANIAVSMNDAGPHLRAAAVDDGIGFHVI